ncbi:dockerin type I repeat-containing protein, partial [Acinetobacter baumannii]|nr:dockerin type I repeat-containing protein [Acinetobacter baumannii]
VKDKIKTSYQIVIYNKKGEALLEEQLVGTGCKIQLQNKQNEMVANYDVIVYGDLNGEGKINSIDLLVLQRHILQLEPLQGVFLKAGNINKNG